MASGNTMFQGIMDKICSNISHIANAYAQPIWISFHSEKLHLDSATVNLNVSAKPSADIGIKLHVTWVKVPKGEYHRKVRSSGSEYITIVSGSTIDTATAAAKEVSAEVLLLNYEILPSQSFILTRDGGFVLQKYGSGNLFEDHTGKDLTPINKKKEFN